MIRTQISLTEEQHEALLERARDRGVSMAALVRAAVDAALLDEDRQRLTDRAIAAVGRFRSPPDDVAEEHDRHLAGIFGRAVER